MIDGNDASSYPAIKGDVTFNDQAKVQIDANGTTVSIATATIGLDIYSYIKPVMPDYEEYDPATAIDNAAVNAKAVKVLRDGQILIIRDGKTYNAQGLLVK